MPKTPEQDNAVPATAAGLRGRIGMVIVGIWVSGTAFFYFVRFSFEFYDAHRGAIDQLLSRF